MKVTLIMTMAVAVDLAAALPAAVVYSVVSDRSNVKFKPYVCIHLPTF